MHMAKDKTEIRARSSIIQLKGEEKNLSLCFKTGKKMDCKKLPADTSASLQ